MSLTDSAHRGSPSLGAVHETAAVPAHCDATANRGSMFGEVDQVVGAIAMRFALAASNELTAALDDAVNDLGRLAGADRVGLWASDGRSLHLRHRFDRFAADRAPGPAASLPLSELHEIGLSTVPGEASVVDGHLLGLLAERVGITDAPSNYSVLLSPLTVAHASFGALTLGASRPRESWPPEIIRAAQTVGSLCAMALARGRAEERLRTSAERDPLTGLPNRTKLSEHLQAVVSRIRRAGGGLAVVFIDLDNFKSINDRWGHAAGDQVLIAVAERLDVMRRRHEMVARLGGDEFVIIGDPVGGEADAQRMADRFAASFAQPFTVDGYRWSGGASVGVVFHGGETDIDARELLRAADAAMYERKRERRVEGDRAAMAPFRAATPVT